MNTFNDREYDRVCDENEALRTDNATLRGLLREDLAGIGHTADWWKRLNKALEGKP